MGQIELFDFPPSEEAFRDLSPIERLMQISERYGQIVSQSILPHELGLSRGRITQLIQAGRFETFTVCGSTWVTVRSVMAFKAAEKSVGGRGHKAA